MLLLPNNTFPSPYEKEDWILNGIAEQVNQQGNWIAPIFVCDKAKLT